MRGASLAASTKMDYGDTTAEEMSAQVDAVKEMDESQMNYLIEKYKSTAATGQDAVRVKMARKIKYLMTTGGRRHGRKTKRRGGRRHGRKTHHRRR